MTPLLYALIYKAFSLLVGVVFAYLGYRLFLAGFSTPGGAASARAGKYSFQLAKVAPGVFFAMFGCVIVGFTIWKGLAAQQKGDDGYTIVASAAPQRLKDREASVEVGDGSAATTENAGQGASGGMDGRYEPIAKLPERIPVVEALNGPQRTPAELARADIAERYYVVARGAYYAGQWDQAHEFLILTQKNIASVPMFNADNGEFQHELNLAIKQSANRGKINDPNK